MKVVYYLTECLIHNQHDFWGLFLGEAALGAIPVPLGFLNGIFGYCWQMVYTPEWCQ